MARPAGGRGDCSWGEAWWFRSSWDWWRGAYEGNRTGGIPLSMPSAYRIRGEIGNVGAENVRNAMIQGALWRFRENRENGFGAPIRIRT